MPSRSRNDFVTATLRRTATTLASSMRCLKETAELLNASRACLNSRAVFIGAKTTVERLNSREQNGDETEEPTRS